MVNILSQGKLYLGKITVMEVTLGAFGAHGLKDLLPADKLQTYNTGITYHFYHLLAICISTLVFIHSNGKFVKISIWLFLAGIIMFSGSLYLLACREVLGIVNYKWIGPITPIGGVFFILGWVFLALEITRIKNVN